MVSQISTLNAHILGPILGKTAGSVQSDLSRAPHRLPPPIKIEGTRQTLWLASTVLEWLQARQVELRPRRGRPTKREQIDRAAKAAAAGSPA